MGIFNVIIWLAGAAAGARLPQHSSSCRVQTGCEVGSGRREPAERVGETFHLVKFLLQHSSEQSLLLQGGEGD